MKRFLLYTAAALIMAGSFTSCKYEEGPGISFRSKKARIEGDWKVTRYVEDGVDMTSDMNGLVIKATKDGDITYTQDGLSITGTWELVQGDERLRIAFSGIPSTDYEIIQLKNKSIKLKYAKDGETEEWTWEQ